MDTATVQAAAAVASLLVAGAAVAVAWLAKEVADDANKIADDARDIARGSVVESRRQAMLAAIPHLAVDLVEVQRRASQETVRLKLTVRNGGPTVAYGILASAAGTAERSLDTIDEDSRRQSGRKVAVAAGGELPLYVPVEHLVVSGSNLKFEWMALRLEYYGPLGGRVRQDYVWNSKPSRTVLRLHRTSIDPRDGGEPVRFDLVLGRFEDED